MTRFLRIAAATAGVLLALAPPAAGALAARSSPAVPDPRLMRLRLPDLPAGYRVGDDSGCELELVGEEDRYAALTTLTSHHPNHGCVAELEQLWRTVPASSAPPLVTSAAFAFDSSAGTQAAMQVGRDVVSYLAGVESVSLVPMSAGTTIGDASAVYRTDDALVDGQPGRPGVAVLWRSGTALALVFVAGLEPAAGEQAALRLAAAQQRRIKSPTPLAPRDYDDREVALDNPHLGIDVYWLGRRFAPGGKLKSLVLQGADGPPPDASALGRADLQYGRTRYGVTNVMLDMWRPPAWAHFARTRFGGLVWHERCVKVQRVAVPHGRAVIYGGFSKIQHRCVGRRPDRFVAHVHLPHVVITVNAPLCWSCRDGGGPYDSFAAMRAVVRGLRRRIPSHSLHSGATPSG